MKALAIFKDSFREAVDSKVIYVTVGLSVLLALLAGSLSFTPVPAAEAIPAILRSEAFMVVYRDRGRSPQAAIPQVNYSITDLQELNDATSPPEGDYRFTVNVLGPDNFRHGVAFWALPPDGDVPPELDGEKVFGESVRILNAPTDGKSTLTVSDSEMEDFLRDQLVLAGNLQVKEVKKLPSLFPQMLRFQVETTGSRTVRGWLHTPELFFGALPIPFMQSSLGYRVFWIEDKIVNGFGAWIGILIGVVITAFFVPNMLRKGTIDLLLVKPIRRPALLIYKYFGGLTFVLLNSAVAVGGVWLALGLRSGIWAPGFLLTVFVLTFFFAILYSVSVLFGVLTRSAIVSILLTCFAWAFLWVVGVTYHSLDEVKDVPTIRKSIPDWVYTTTNVVHFVLPRTKDLDILTTQLLSRQVLTEGDIRRQRLDRPLAVSWGESLTVSGVFIALMLGLACWRFSTRDY
jgi:ABC-type transport system involved in multi-copper enzyme maturation permease subunit